MLQLGCIVEPCVVPHIIPVLCQLLSGCTVPAWEGVVLKVTLAMTKDMQSWSTSDPSQSRHLLVQSASPFISATHGVTQVSLESHRWNTGSKTACPVPQLTAPVRRTKPVPAVCNVSDATSSSPQPRVWPNVITNETRPSYQKYLQWHQHPLAGTPAVTMWIHSVYAPQFEAPSRAALMEFTDSQTTCKRHGSHETAADSHK
jgi:hypothetical protein